MPGLMCQFCGKDWVQPCWDANEAASCGNLTPADISRLEQMAKNAKARIGRAKRKGK